MGWKNYECNSEASISVIIACYNSGSTLGETLNSLLAQSYKNWEAIIVDDGSKDNSKSIAKKFTTKDTRIRLIEKEKNAGVSAARNVGIANARGAFLNFLDSDDLLQPKAFETMVKHLNQRIGYSGVYGDYKLLFNSGKTLYRRSIDDSEISFEALCLGNQFCPVFPILFKAEVLADAGVFDESIAIGEDWDLWIRIYRSGHRFAHIPECVGFYRITSGGLHSQLFRAWLSESCVVDLTYRNDDRCIHPRPEYACELSAEKKNMVQAKLKAYYLTKALISNDEASIKSIITAINDQPLAKIDAFELADKVLYEIKFEPNGKELLGNKWPKFSHTLERNLKHFSRCWNDKAYLQKFFFQLLTRSPQRANRIKMFFTACHHGVTLKFGVLKLFLSSAYQSLIRRVLISFRKQLI